MLLDAGAGAGVIFLGAIFLFLVVLIPIVTLGIVLIVVAINNRKKSAKMQAQAAMNESEEVAEVADNKSDEV